MVFTCTPQSLPLRQTRIPSAVRSVLMLHSASFASTGFRCSSCTFSRMISPPVIAAAAKNVPASMRSGMTRCTAPCSSFPPRIVIVSVPSPSISAPIFRRKSARSQISGSAAAFSIVVIPFARVAASRIFSVAPTLGKSR